MPCYFQTRRPGAWCVLGGLIGLMFCGGCCDGPEPKPTPITVSTLRAPLPDGMRADGTVDPHLFDIALVMAGKPPLAGGKATFSAGEVEALRSLTLPSSNFVPDLNFYEKIHDPATCEVERHMYNFDGRPGGVSVVKMEPKEFWSMIEAVSQIKGYTGSYPMGPINLSTALSSAKAQYEMKEQKLKAVGKE